MGSYLAMSVSRPALPPDMEDWNLELTGRVSRKTKLVADLRGTTQVE